LGLWFAVIVVLIFFDRSLHVVFIVMLALFDDFCIALFGAYLFVKLKFLCGIKQ